MTACDWREIIHQISKIIDVIELWTTTYQWSASQSVEFTKLIAPWQWQLLCSDERAFYLPWLPTKSSTVVDSSLGPEYHHFPRYWGNFDLLLLHQCKWQFSFTSEELFYRTFLKVKSDTAVSIFQFPSWSVLVISVIFFQKVSQKDCCSCWSIRPVY